MGFVLDSIIKETMLEGPEAISADYNTNSFDMSGVEESHALQIDFSNAVGLDMNIYLGVSVDGNVFSRIDESLQNVTEAGTHIYDITQQGVNFIRVEFVINSGSCDIDKVQFTGKRRH